MWGDTIEEDLWDPNEVFYDVKEAKAERIRSKIRESIQIKPPVPYSQNSIKPPPLKIKKKVIYEYCYDGDSDNGGNKTPNSPYGLEKNYIDGISGIPTNNILFNATKPRITSVRSAAVSRH